MNNLPSLLQYNSDEFLSFNTKFDNEIISNKACKKLLKKFNIELSYQEMQNFLKNNTLSPNLLNFMFNYLQNLDQNMGELMRSLNFNIYQRNDHQQQSQFEKYDEQKLCFTSLPQQQQKQQINSLYIVTAIYVQESWQLIITNIAHRYSYIIDFSGRGQSTQLKQQIENLFQQEFNIDYNKYIIIYKNYNKNQQTDNGSDVVYYINRFIQGIEIENIIIKEEDFKVNQKRTAWIIFKLKYQGGQQQQQLNEQLATKKDQINFGQQQKESFLYLSLDELNRQQFLKQSQQIKEKSFNQTDHCLKQCQTDISLLPQVEYKFLKEGLIIQQSQISKSHSSEIPSSKVTQDNKINKTNPHNFIDKACQTQSDNQSKSMQTKQILLFDKSVQTQVKIEEESSLYDTKYRRLIKMKSFSNMQQLVEGKIKKNERTDLSPNQLTQFSKQIDEQDFLENYLTQKTIQDDELEYQSLRLSNVKLPILPSNNIIINDNLSNSQFQSDKIVLENINPTDNELQLFEQNDVISEGILNYILKFIEEKNNRNSKLKVLCLPTQAHMKLFLKQATYSFIREMIVEKNLLLKCRFILIPAYYHWYNEYALCIIDIKKKLVKQYFLYKRLNIKNDPVFSNLRLIFEREHFNQFKEDLKWTLQIVETNKVGDVNMTGYVLLNIVNQYLRGSTKISAISLKYLKENIIKIIKLENNEEKDKIDLFSNFN